MVGLKLSSPNEFNLVNYDWLVKTSPAVVRQKTHTRLLILSVVAHLSRKVMKSKRYLKVISSFYFNTTTRRFRLTVYILTRKQITSGGSIARQLFGKKLRLFVSQYMQKICSRVGGITGVDLRVKSVPWSLRRNCLNMLRNKFVREILTGVVATPGVKRVYLTATLLESFTPANYLNIIFLKRFVEKNKKHARTLASFVFLLKYLYQLRLLNGNTSYSGFIFVATGTIGRHGRTRTVTKFLGQVSMGSVSSRLWHQNTQCVTPFGCIGLKLWKSFTSVEF